LSRGGQGEFLSRWSRLKREGAGQAAAEPEPEPEPASPPPAEKTDAEILAEHGLPDPDTLSPGDDVRGFMARAIPDRLRNRALRRLWLGNPALANLDGLVDYGEDFTDAATVVANLASAWQAGRGYLKNDPDPEAGPDAPAPAEAAAPTAPDAPDASDEVTEAAGVEPAPAHGQGNAPADDAPPGPAPATARPPPSPAPRRMRFRV